MPEPGRPEPGKQEPKQGKTDSQRIADLELQLASVRATAPLGTVPDHAGGVGQDIAETWSQADQELATAGKHPDQEPEPEPEPSQRK